jgi:hypothetical protein
MFKSNGVQILVNDSAGKRLLLMEGTAKGKK